MAQDNQTILANAWIEGSNDFQQRIPDPTQAGIAATIDAIFAPMNNRFYNEFVDTLVQRIGYTYVHQQRFRNPLAVFKKEFMYYGATVQETFFKWIKAHSYDDASETLLKMRRPEAEVCYHTVNRQDRYDITVVRQELQQAAAEEFGLNRYIAGIMDIPMNSDAYDEYQIMKELIAFYEQSWGFFKVNGSVPTDETTAKTLLKQLRAFGGKLRFPSSLYNAAIVQDIPVFVNNPSELVLLVTPEVQASLDVDALAVLFNMDKADVQSRIVIIDEFPIAGAYALLTTDEFFQCRDTLLENASFYNPETLGVNYFLHHWGVYSVSPFVPAILFTTEAGSSTPVIEVEPATLTLGVKGAYEIWPGGKVQLTAEFSGNVTANDRGIDVQPDAAKWTVQLYDSNNDPVVVNSRTYVDRLGVLHLQKSGIDVGGVVVLSAAPAYVNPSGADPAVTVVGNYGDNLVLVVVDAPTRTVDLYTADFVSVSADSQTITVENHTAQLTAHATGTYSTEFGISITPALYSDLEYSVQMQRVSAGDWVNDGSAISSPADTITSSMAYSTASPNWSTATYRLAVSTIKDGDTMGTTYSAPLVFSRNYDANAKADAILDPIEDPGETRE